MAENTKTRPMRVYYPKRPVVRIPSCVRCCDARTHLQTTLRTSQELESGILNLELPSLAFAACPTESAENFE